MTVPAIEAARPQRCVIHVGGIVQGVGFRPFVYALATRLGLGGFICNRADGVIIEIEGAPSQLDSFLKEMDLHCPPAARIEQIQVARVPPRGEMAFSIGASDASMQPEERFFSPDVGTCDACLEELFDASDRRYRYPFINCSQCGPRFTIVRNAPYDRERTTMAAFAMCGPCRAEYDDPQNRRFHAQPIACSACGPKLAARDSEGRELVVDALLFFEELLLASRIIAVKGIGGYHLTCDASSETATRRLRDRKHREEKAFAVMVADIAAARRLCDISATEADLLSSARRPIVLLRRRADAPVAESVAPGNPLLGVMLPYSPLHHLLARSAGRPLVLTSGNRSDEPIAFEDGDALMRLKGIADGFLTHDRAIHLRCDDSVVRETSNAPALIRRSRGYAPEPLRLPAPCRPRVLALGGHIKNTFALGRGKHAFLSHHIGDLGEWEAYKSFRNAIGHYQALFAFEPEVIAHDLHPLYSTTEYARERASQPGVRLIGVQHHHAHMASCMAEHGLSGPAIGVTFDGTGYGSDGSLWGGEFLVGDYRKFHRAAHLRPIPLPGGERAIREPWRMAVACLLDCGEEPEKLRSSVRTEDIRIVRHMIEKRLHSPLTSSAGRLFDAVAALLGVRGDTTFEGQAAMELEWLAESSNAPDGYPFEIVDGADSRALLVDTRPLFKALVDAVPRGDRATIARRFHNTLAEIVDVVVGRLSDATGIEDVVLTGGVFQNALLLEMTRRKLETRGLAVYTHTRVPANDGGLAFGQLAVAAQAEDA